MEGGGKSQVDVPGPPGRAAYAREMSHPQHSALPHFRTERLNLTVNEFGLAICFRMSLRFDADEVSG